MRADFLAATGFESLVRDLSLHALAELATCAALWRDRYEPVRERYEIARALHADYPEGFLHTLRHSCGGSLMYEGTRRSPRLAWRSLAWQRVGVLIDDTP